MQDQGHGGRNALLVAIIGALGIVLAAVITPIVENSLEDEGNRPEPTVRVEPSAQAEPPRPPISVGLRTTGVVSVREFPRSDALVLQEIPAGTWVSPGLAMAIDSEGTKRMKIRVVGGTTGWVLDPPPVEGVLGGRP